MRWREDTTKRLKRQLRVGGMSETISAHVSIRHKMATERVRHLIHIATGLIVFKKAEMMHCFTD